MELMILTILLLLLGLVVFLVWHMREGRGRKETLENFLNEKFNDFSGKVRETMNSTRQEVEKSKDVLSAGTIKTLEHLKDMNEVVGKLSKQQEKAQELGQSLEYLLQSPKLRGDYGETILEEMLDKVLPKGIWERQYAIAGGERVDAVVKYKDIVIPIDSKFPKEDYQKYIACGDLLEKRRHWANYEKALKIQINLIKEKYVKPEAGTTEFALLFIPSESIYYETIAEKNYLGQPCQIYEYAADHKVIPVSPNTFYAFLNVIMLGVRNIEIVREAKKLQEMLTRIERDFDFFYSNFEVIGKAINKAANSYDKGNIQIQRFRRNLESVLKLELPSQEESREEVLIEEGSPLSRG
ncbi:MAG: DNA recombination protein RmuC [Candidatus Omnitrophota bacterium]